MPNLQLGSLVLNTELLLYLIAGAAGVLLVWLSSRSSEASSRFVSSAWSAVWIWIVVWKASFIVFDFSAFRDNWKSLLFFDGGIKGLIAASVISAAFATLQFIKAANAKTAFKLLLALIAGWLAVYSAAQILFADWPSFQHYLLLAWSIAAAIGVVKPPKAALKQAFPQLLGLLLITGLVSYFAYDVVENNWRSTPVSGSAEQNIGIKPGQYSPDFQTVNLQGEAVSLSQFKGKTVLLNFWTTWCTVCKAEMPHVQKLHESLEEQDFVILSINATSQDSGAEQARRYIENGELTFPVALDPSGSISQAYRVRAFPVTLVIDPEGVVQKYHIGAISYEQMRKAVLAASSKQ
ncbi:MULTISPECIES: TlpA family protein disulfide reductase [unclassified Paenibacillus]|uniref:TlpA family protein disulfide reductase n=1 Tax=unclassified Paenibacillus TaxID=185978 RepID=UPI002F403493